MTGTALECIAYITEQAKEYPDARWDVEKHREKKSKRQNGYYWALLTQVADKMKMSKPRAHNWMLRRYGRRAFRIDGNLIPTYLPDTDEIEEQQWESEYFHTAPTTKIISREMYVDITGNKDAPQCNYRQYVMLRGSSDFNTYEMSVLLDGLIEEAKQQGIDTITPEERERLKQYDLEWEKKHG